MISVIISTYQRREKLKRAVESVLAQTYADFEVLVVHDGPAPLDYYNDCPKDERVHYLATETRHGKDTKGKNFGIKESSGEYIAYLDDDNEWYPEFLSSQLDTIQKTGVDVVYCDMLVFNDEKPNAAPSPAISLPYDQQVLMRKNFIDTSMVMHKRQAVLDVGGWDETLPRFVDWNLWVRMTKWGHTFYQNKTILTKYYISNSNSATKHPVRMWKDPVLGLMFEPTFDTSGCLIWLPYLGPNEAESNPKVAVYTLSYDRVEYTKRMWESLQKSTKYPFDWFVWDNGSKDESVSYLEAQKRLIPTFKHLHVSPDNKGITIASNGLIDEIMKGDYQLVIKVDNDCEFMTKWWLESFVDLWKRNHKLYMSPYPEGLQHNPGGAPRIGHAFIGAYFIEVALHIGGLIAAVDARAYKDFRWTDHFLHGNQDAEASAAFRELDYMPMYLPMHRVCHMDTTIGQQKNYPEYFERRKKEKTQIYE